MLPTLRNADKIREQVPDLANKKCTRQSKSAVID
jgi:hypothetical protein